MQHAQQVEQVAEWDLPAKGIGMSNDIVKRLRSLRHIHVPQLSDEAAAEIERLRAVLSRTGSSSRQTSDNATECRSQGEKLPERERLADAEREAVEWYAAYGAGEHAATLRALLERLA